MEKRIFLTGAEAETRSRLIREALGEKLAEAGGFVLRAEPGQDGFAEGYALCPAAAAGGDVTTALDEDIQAVCESAARHAAEDGGRSAAVVVMRVDTSEVVALACSGDYLGGGGSDIVRQRIVAADVSELFEEIGCSLGVFGDGLQRVLANLRMGIVEGRRPQRRDDHRP